MRVSTYKAISLAALLQLATASIKGHTTTFRDAFATTQAPCTTTLWLDPPDGLFDGRETHYLDTITTTRSLPCEGCQLEFQTNLGREYSSVEVSFTTSKLDPTVTVELVCSVTPPPLPTVAGPWGDVTGSAKRNAASTTASSGFGTVTTTAISGSKDAKERWLGHDE